ncbi:transcription initiation factor TFIID subunit 1-like [Dreissena polymorpha]|uniref:CUB domain-containing protein n=1 Tax=Dreissena polymorpha TaxID=45954 RepID=A0A9D4J6S6_DREPO|nr:transcription initiation factor TFIID subunit 1-like [Dreissena polymorpha]XP_052221767.1 transcription initiation factor TFIID subunit 1-like [Dreissena polymorpha]KAH3797673.1 hypothetical protein DPMN_151258 [Dreissena polymorpha]
MNQIKTSVLEICIVLLCVNGCCGQASGSEVCKIQDGLQGECRYRIDHVNLDVIWVKIDPCSDPVAVTFTITNDKTYMDLSHTFKGSQIIRLHGYSERIFLHVTMGETFSGTFRLEADIERYDGTNTDFIYQDFDLQVASEQCFNIASKIAIGIMSVLFLVAIAMGIVLLVLWRRKRKAENCAGTSQRNGAGPSSSTTAASLGTGEILLNHSLANAAEMDNNNFDNNNTVNLNRVFEAGQNENRNANRATENVGGVNEQTEFHVESLNGLAVLESCARTGHDRNGVVDSSGHANVDGRNVSDRHCTARPSASQGQVHRLGNGRRQETAGHLQQSHHRSCKDDTYTDLVHPARAGGSRSGENDENTGNTDSLENHVRPTSNEDSNDGVHANNGSGTRLHENRSRNHAPKGSDNVVSSRQRQPHVRKGLSDGTRSETVHRRTPARDHVDGSDGRRRSGADGGIADESCGHFSDCSGGVGKSHEHG